MSEDEDIVSMSVGDENAPFGGPDPARDSNVSTQPETDGDVDQQELYDAGLQVAAETPTSDADETNDSQAADLPEGFHIEDGVS